VFNMICTMTRAVHNVIPILQMEPTSVFMQPKFRCKY
jgi:hypothetical protein